MIDTIVNRFNANIARVDNLVRLYEQTHGHGRGRRSIGANDILRAATVLLHASLEDLLRSIARWRIPIAGDPVLNKVPLAGSPGRFEKFGLGALAAHRGKTIDEVIRESVREHLERTSYSSTEEIGSFLQAIGVAVAQVNARFADLDAMTRRRHHIVHQADHNPERGRGRHRARQISVHDVRKWITAVRQFAQALEVELRALP